MYQGCNRYAEEEESCIMSSDSAPWDGHLDWSLGWLSADVLGLSLLSRLASVVKSFVIRFSGELSSRVPFGAVLSSCDLIVEALLTLEVTGRDAQRGF